LEDKRMIVVIGSVTAQAGRLPEALTLSRQHVARSRAEPGCISHAVHHDSENAQRLVFVEEWSDRAALAQHFRVPESRAFVKALAALATEPPQIKIYEATPVQV
jgi:quinol monooxygenase YgiN